VHGQMGFLLGCSLVHVGTSSTYGVVGVCKDRVWIWVVGVGGVVVGVVFWNKSMHHTTYSFYSSRQTEFWTHQLGQVTPSA